MPSAQDTTLTRRNSGYSMLFLAACLLTGIWFAIEFGSLASNHRDTTSQAIYFAAALLLTVLTFVAIFCIAVLVREVGAVEVFGERTILETVYGKKRFRTVQIREMFVTGIMPRIGAPQGSMRYVLVHTDAGVFAIPPELYAKLRAMRNAAEKA